MITNGPWNIKNCQLSSWLGNCSDHAPKSAAKDRTSTLWKTTNILRRHWSAVDILWLTDECFDWLSSSTVDVRTLTGLVILNESIFVWLQRGALTGAMARRGGRGVSAEPSEQEVLGVMMRGHDSMMAVLTARLRVLHVSVSTCF